MWQELAKETGARCVETQAKLDRAAEAWAARQLHLESEVSRLESEVSRLESEGSEWRARAEEQGARIVALNEEWASVQGELSAVETRLHTTLQEQAVAEAQAARQISQLQEDLNAYIGRWVGR